MLDYQQLETARLIIMAGGLIIGFGILITLIVFAIKRR